MDIVLRCPIFWNKKSKDANMFELYDSIERGQERRQTFEQMSLLITNIAIE